MLFEHMFDTRGVVVSAGSAATAASAAEVVSAEVISAAALLRRREGFAVSPPFAEAFPGGVMQRGSVIVVERSATLTLALIADIARQGGWSAEVGGPPLGAAAAAEYQIPADRFVRIPSPGGRWMTAVAALVEAFDLVVVHVAGTPAEQRRLTARVRERSAILLTTVPWEGATARFAVTDRRWSGLGQGDGCLQGAEFTVRVMSRGTGGHPRHFRWRPRFSSATPSAA
ncbi:hypothetical protein Acel_0993 [Acidothermus cellulolyticus 11B]|uniref:Recombinase A n=1 Tax=Acidothermus cellulolyticus (strain ATCC 43068 / DSM 8971 / 11B) TaxID=351607 RepID=A0LTK6_ACIC1|nr:hypothetical protein Acel_0993 [Acidothermus cellulolyticus 11B]